MTGTLFGQELHRIEGHSYLNEEEQEELLRTMDGDDAHHYASMLAGQWRQVSSEFPESFNQPPGSLVRLVEDVIGEPVWPE